MISKYYIMEAGRMKKYRTAAPIVDMQKAAQRAAFAHIAGFETIHSRERRNS